MPAADIVIAGAGIVGLALALELRSVGHTVLLLAPELPGYSSIAAAGMLAAHDPANPPALRSLAEFSLTLYPAFLDRIRQLTGTAVSFETRYVLEADSLGQLANFLLPSLTREQLFTLRPEWSLDPRKLLPALRAAVVAGGTELRAARLVQVLSGGGSSVRLSTTDGLLEAGTFIDCTGAWAAACPAPAKGQMLRIQLPPHTLQHATLGNLVLRTPQVYIVPRLDGTALIGATVEDAGFTTHTSIADLRKLREKASSLLPELAQAPVLESWAGLRPRTPDDLPLLGSLGPNHYIATGHFRNGILLAPATARLLAQLIAAETPVIPLQAFDPHRFRPAPHHTGQPIIVHV